MLRIEQVLYEKRMSQSKAARLADVNQTSFSRIVRGKEPAFPKRGQRIADASAGRVIGPSCSRRWTNDSDRRAATPA